MPFARRDHGIDDAAQPRRRETGEQHQQRPAETTRDHDIQRAALGPAVGSRRMRRKHQRMMRYQSQPAAEPQIKVMPSVRGSSLNSTIQPDQSKAKAMALSINGVVGFMAPSLAIGMAPT